ncbi:hypothetical protein OR16_26133 [Cupriavidus basilensis OR16]|uniref:Uncharacterized protein n=1 Tax=Cupriavidus basilensis OR16 TaxID=1127483 RepID=H1SAS1_9BURK|nr:hypothetical protein OR16_26133 [Cupriavidus basilensis OR16]
MAGLEFALQVVVLDDGVLVRMRMGRHQGHWNFGGRGRDFGTGDTLWGTRAGKGREFSGLSG